VLETHNITTLSVGGVQSVAMIVSVGLSVHSHKNNTSKPRKVFGTCCLWPWFGPPSSLPFPSSRHHLSNDYCPEDKKQDVITRQCCTVYDSCDASTHSWAVLKLDCGFRFSLGSGLLFVFFFHSVLVLFPFVMLGLVSLVLGQKIG